MEDRDRSKGRTGEDQGSYSGWEEERRARREAHRRRRERARSEEPKDRVLHTRITEDLAEDIRRVAEDLRVPVSNLVRNVLEDVFNALESVADNVGEVVEDVVRDVDGAARRLRQRAHRYSPETHPPPPEPEPPRESASSALPEFPDVVGWQPLILNAERPCAGCGRDVRRGERAFAGLGASGISDAYLCRSCAREVV